MRHFDKCDVIVHTDYSDGLPDDHPWVNDDVECCVCGSLVHAHNNEAMTQWAEFDGMALCCDCWLKENMCMSIWYDDSGNRRKGHKC